ncbi:MAG: SDR family oxidoreductase [Betaproteobacteria bacterium]|nr:SDR family oxidoreductase [Betaproteobacteria bacterium]
MTINRRKFIQAAGAGASVLGFPSIVRAQDAPIRLGLMTVKTGPLASGGLDMERALVMYLRERNNMLAGRKVELFVADSGGVPAQARSKTQELVERDKINIMIGPLAAGEALATDDYIRQQQLPTLSVAAAEDMTQRNPNPWFVRGTSTSAQCAHPLADYCIKQLKYKRMAVIADDIPYGHEMCAGFQRVFEEQGGKIVQKMFPPLTVPDYGTFLAQLKTNIDGVFLGTKHSMRLMAESTPVNGSIINISSIMGLIGHPGIGAYNASKGGVRLYTKSVALSCAEKGLKIRVNSIHPGFIDTPLLRESMARMRDPEQAQKTYDALQPVGHLGQPQDIAYGVLYLASDESRFMTGAELVIDGGYTAR